MYFPMKFSLKYIPIVKFLFLPWISFPNLLLYFMWFRVISCCNFNNECNKHNQHFTVTKLAQYAVLQISFSHISCCVHSLFPYNTFYLFSRFLVTTKPTPPLLDPTPSQSTLFRFRIHDLKLVVGREVHCASLCRYYCSRT
jgi:hypothetical protein